MQVYQFRHHDVTSTAHLVFLVIALALIFEVVGIFTSSVFFWVLFIFFYISFVLVFIIQVISSSLFIQTTKSYNIFKMSDISQLVWTWHQNQNCPSDAECEIIGPMWWRKCNQRLFPSCSLFWICACLSGKYTAILYFKSVHKSIVCQVNIAMAFWFFYKRSPGVSRYILAIMMVNMVLYISNYICCKLYYR